VPILGEFCQREDVVDGSLEVVLCRYPVLQQHNMILPHRDFRSRRELRRVRSGHQGASNKGRIVAATEFREELERPHGD
jgi:hypothetical protein